MLKKLAVPVAVGLFAVSAMATNFRASDQVYLPAAGHIGTFVSDVYVSNLSTDTVTVTVYFSQNGQTGTTTPLSSHFNLAPLERRQISDILGAATSSGGFNITSGLGMMIFNGCLANADCGPATQDPQTGVSPNFRNISVESRIYSTTGNGTTGQLFSGYPWYNYVSELSPNGLNQVFITGLTNTGTSGATFRANLGVVNASQYSNTNITFKLYNGNNPTTPVSTRTIGLGPLGFYQANMSSIFNDPGASPQFNPTGSGFFVVVSQSGSAPISSDPNVVPTYCQQQQGCPGFYAYGSVVDNITTDATTLEPQYLQPLTDAQINCIYPGAGTTPCKGSPTFHRNARH